MNIQDMEWVLNSIDAAIHKHLGKPEPKPKHEAGQIVFINTRSGIASLRISSVKSYHANNKISWFYVFEEHGTYPESEVYRDPKELIKAQLNYWHKQLADYEDVNSYKPLTSADLGL
jgi:hypothetical protein